MNRLASAVAGSIMLTGAAFAAEEPSPFAEPSASYMNQFAKPHAKVFVYERYDAGGRMAERVINPIEGEVQVIDATTRKFNGFPVRLRGLLGCVQSEILYEGRKFPCKDAAQDYAGAVYGRGSVILCKTLVLKTDPRLPDPASCYVRVGDGSSLNPFIVASDDDSMVFLGMASIGTTKEGKSLRPDLQESQKMGQDFIKGSLEEQKRQSEAVEEEPADENK